MHKLQHILSVWISLCRQSKSFDETIFTADSSFAPGVNASTAPYQCTYNLRGSTSTLLEDLSGDISLVKAHAGAVKAFRSMKIQGEIAYKNDDFM